MTYTVLYTSSGKICRVVPPPPQRALFETQMQSLSGEAHIIIMYAQSPHCD